MDAVVQRRTVFLAIARTSKRIALLEIARQLNVRKIGVGDDEKYEKAKRREHPPESDDNSP
jgi:hypothetical protein